MENEKKKTMNLYLTIEERMNDKESRNKNKILIFFSYILYQSFYLNLYNLILIIIYKKFKIFERPPL